MVYPPTGGTVSHPSTKHGRESNSQPVDHESDALTTTPPRHHVAKCIFNFGIKCRKMTTDYTSHSSKYNINILKMKLMHTAITHKHMNGLLVYDQFDHGIFES